MVSVGTPQPPGHEMPPSRATALSAPASPPAEDDLRQRLTTLADLFLVLFDALPHAGFVDQPLFTPCPQCRKLLPLHARFCGQCGYSIASNAPQALVTPAPPCPAGTALHQHLQTYFLLAESVWEAAAAEELEALARESGFTRALNDLAQDLQYMLDACRNTQHHPYARGSWNWRWRVRLYRRALLDWKPCLGARSQEMLLDPADAGHRLYRAQSRLGLATLSNTALLLLRSMLVLGTVASGVLLFVFISEHSLIYNDVLGKFTFLFTLLTLGMLLVLTGGPFLPLAVGYSLARPQAVSFSRQPSDASQLETNGGTWHTILPRGMKALGSLLLVGVPLLLVLTLISKSYLDDPNAVSVTGVLDTNARGIGSLALGVVYGSDPAIDLAGTNINVPQYEQDLGYFFLMIGLPLLCLLLIALFFLPFTLTTQVRLAREMRTHATRSPEARRYALRPALRLVLFHSIIVLFLIVEVFHLAPLRTLLSTPLFQAPLSFITVRQLVYIPLFLSLYLLLVEIPYRRGIALWRLAKLKALAPYRNIVAAHFSQKETETPEQAGKRKTEEINSLWQYYTKEVEEVKAVRSGPITLVQSTVLWLVPILLAFLQEQITNGLHAGADKLLHR